MSVAIIDISTKTQLSNHADRQSPTGVSHYVATIDELAEGGTSVSSSRVARPRWRLIDERTEQNSPSTTATVTTLLPARRLGAATSPITHIDRAPVVTSSQRRRGFSPAAAAAAVEYRTTLAHFAGELRQPHLRHGTTQVPSAARTKSVADADPTQSRLN